MGLKAVGAPSLSLLGGIPIQTTATPRNLLAQICLIATPAFALSARQAFSDSGRATPSVDGGVVQTMRDITGNGLNGVQSTATSQPTWRANGISNNYPGLDFTASTARNIKVTGAFTSAFSAGYTIYVAATSLGAQTSSEVIDVLAYISNGDYVAIQAGSGNGVIASFNGGASHVNFDIGGNNDYSGVYVSSYDGTTATVGLNGRYASSVISGTVPTNHNLFIGDDNGSTFNWSTGLVGDVWVFPGKHTVAQMDAIGAILAADIGTLAPGFIFVGDSQTSGFGLATPTTMNWTYQLCQLLGCSPGTLTAKGYSGITVQIGSPNGNILYLNRALPGEDLATMITDVTATAPWQTTGFVSKVRGSHNIAFIMGGTNDMAGNVDGVSAATAFARLQQLCALYRSSSCDVAVATCLPRSASTAGASFDATRLAFNQMIYQAGTSLYDILLDFGGSPVMGPASALSNSALYQSDQIHPAEQGATVLANVAALAVQQYYSKTPIILPSTGPIIPSFTKQLPGATAGTVSWSMPFQGSSYKKFVAYFNGYENNTAGNQTITFPTPFLNTPAVITNGTGLTVSASATALTITSPDNTSTFTGNVIVEGF